jgi:hypothetical protein
MKKGAQYIGPGFLLSPRPALNAIKGTVVILVRGFLNLNLAQ